MARVYKKNIRIKLQHAHKMRIFQKLKLCETSGAL
jgi:hypothetical protein